VRRLGKRANFAGSEYRSFQKGSDSCNAPFISHWRVENHNSNSSIELGLFQLSHEILSVTVMFHILDRLNLMAAHGSLRLSGRDPRVSFLRMLL